MRLITLLLIALLVSCEVKPEVIIPQITATPKVEYLVATAKPILQTSTPTLEIKKTAIPTLTPTSYTSIIWTEAQNYVSEVKTVCGPVIGVTYAADSNGQPTFINIGMNYPSPQRFTVVIWGRSRGLFIDKPEEAFSDQDICVTGTISTYKGVLEMEVSQPSQVFFP